MPFPDPHLTLGEARQLAKGRSCADRYLQEQIDRLRRPEERREHHERHEKHEKRPLVSFRVFRGALLRAAEGAKYNVNFR